jgi:hypothetical protein
MKIITLTPAQQTAITNAVNAISTAQTNAATLNTNIATAEANFSAALANIAGVPSLVYGSTQPGGVLISSDQTALVVF